MTLITIPTPSLLPIPIPTNRRIYIQNLINLLHASLLKEDYERAERSWAILIRCRELDWRRTWRWGMAVLELGIEAGDGKRRNGSGKGKAREQDDGSGESMFERQTYKEEQEDNDSMDVDDLNHPDLDSSTSHYRRDLPNSDRLRYNREVFLRRLQTSLPAMQRPEMLVVLIQQLVKEGESRKALDELELYLPSHPYTLSSPLHIYAGLISFHLAQPDSPPSPVRLPLPRRNLDRRHSRSPSQSDDSSSSHEKLPPTRSSPSTHSRSTSDRRVQSSTTGDEMSDDEDIRLGYGDGSSGKDPAAGWDKALLRDSLRYFTKGREIATDETSRGNQHNDLEEHGNQGQVSELMGSQDDLPGVWIKRIKRMLGERNRIVMDTSDGGSAAGQMRSSSAVPSLAGRMSSRLSISNQSDEDEESEHEKGESVPSDRRRATSELTVGGQNGMGVRRDKVGEGSAEYAESDSNDDEDDLDDGKSEYSDVSIG